jgi:polysaccharide chain length determinant protein (PEP-CTERM system associated)
MTEFPSMVRDVLRGMWQGRWVGLGVAWVAGICSATYIFMTPDRYEATARVYVDTQSILKPLMSGLAVQPNVAQEVAILSRTLISRPNLQKLVRMTDMDLNARTNEERERLIDGVQKKLFIQSLGRDNLYTIGFTATRPEQAGRVVQSLLSIFVESGLTAKSGDAGQARRFIEEQIKSYEKRLTEAENRVKEFKLQNIDLNAPAGGDFFSSMATLTANLTEARMLLQEARRSRDSLKRQLADEQNRPPSLLPELGNLPTVATAELDARLNTLRKNLDEMLLRYTDDHPDVVNTRRIIKEVEAQRTVERERLAKELEKQRKSGASPSEGNGLFPQLKMAFAQSEAQVAALEGRVADLERRLAQQHERARSVPEREAQFTQLNRDYAIHKQNYDNLVQRRESVVMSSEMGARTGVADFRIIDPPRVSPTPVAPDRKLLMPLALLASLFAGIAASYLFSVLRPTVHDSRTLKRVGKRPVLGAVSIVPGPEVLARRRRSSVAFVGGVSGLAVTYGATVAVVFLRGLLPF